MTPSAVSNALARLRHELGDPLVVRSGRGVVPTPRALALAPTLRDALHSLRRALYEESFDPSTTARRFTLAMADAGQVSQLPKLARLMAAEMPRASLRVIGIDTFLSWGGVVSAEIDVAIGRFDDQVPGVHLTALYQERGVLVARRGHSLARRRVTAAKLRLLGHVDVEVAPGRGYRDLHESYARHGIRRAVAMIVPTFVAAAAAVAQTDWVATLPMSLLQTLKDHFGLVALSGVAPIVQVPLNLVWHDRTHADPAARAFRAIVGRSLHAP